MIGIDWGSTNVRAFRFDPGGAVVERRATAQGAARLRGPTAFEAALADIVAGWSDGTRPIVIAGMAGGRDGLKEMAYLDCPADVQALAAAAGRLDLRSGPCFVLPGLRCSRADGTGDVMRGEETQLAGLEVQDGIVILPGTHSKWVRLADGKVADFQTMMTGELFALLRDHGLIGRLADQGADHDESAYARGLDRAREAGAALRLLFSARADVLLGTLTAAATLSYLSGLLIGGEIAEMKPVREERVTLVGSGHLIALYEAALRRSGISAVTSRRLLCLAPRMTIFRSPMGRRFSGTAIDFLPAR